MCAKYCHKYKYIFRNYKPVASRKFIPLLRKNLCLQPYGTESRGVEISSKIGYLLIF